MHTVPPFLALSFAAGLLLAPLTGGTWAADATEKLAIRGAGSTFAAPIIQQWMETFGAAHPELRLSYDAVGSGEGIDRFLAGTVELAASDAPLKPAQVAAVTAGAHQIPVTAGLIVLTYNLPGIASPLNLPRDVYPDIFLGHISRWDDPRIAAANPGVKLPHKLIQVVARQDSSGTTFAFTNHLGAINPENLTVLIPDPEGARSYPIVTYSWALVYDRYPNAATAQAIQALLRWSLTQGQAQAESIGYIPLPANAANAALAEVETIGG